MLNQTHKFLSTNIKNAFMGKHAFSMPQIEDKMVLYLIGWKDKNINYIIISYRAFIIG